MLYTRQRVALREKNIADIRVNSISIYYINTMYIVLTAISLMLKQAKYRYKHEENTTLLDTGHVKVITRVD